MSSLIVLYALIGIVVGTFLNFLFTGGSTRMDDLLLGAISGLAVGTVLWFSKSKLWGRK